jgi:hypothetical protein
MAIAHPWPWNSVKQPQGQASHAPKGWPKIGGGWLSPFKETACRNFPEAPQT